MQGHASISNEILASYAADAAREVPGVRGLVEQRLQRHRGVRITEDDGRVSVELHVGVLWGASIPEVGTEVQRRVREYLRQMADLDVDGVEVVVDDVGAP
jgi:uncharacterized alkaline shock family protein YloU